MGFLVKLKADKTLDKYIVHLVAKGFLQMAAMDFFETFSPIMKPTTTIVFLAIALSKG